MGDSNNEIYIAQEERDPERLERIIRHSSRRQDAPVVLVQLPNANPSPVDSEFPFTPQRRATIVNTAGTQQFTLEEKIDPFEWYFHRNNPDLRKNLVQEGAVDELSSRRKSRIGGDQMEEMLMMFSNKSLNRCSVSFDIQERENDKVDSNIATPTRMKAVKRQPETEERRKSDNTSKGSKVSETPRKFNAEKISGEGHNGAVNNDGRKNEEVKQLEQFEGNEDDLPVIDTIFNSLRDSKEEIRVMPEEYSLKDTKMNFKFSDANEVTVMPAQYSFTDQKSPFKKDRDEIRPRPSSRVRVLLMLDEWTEEDDGMEDTIGRKRHAKGEGGKKRRSKDQCCGKRDSRESSSGTMYSNDEIRREYISDKPPLKDKRSYKEGKEKGPERYEKCGKYESWEEERRGGKPRYRENDWGDRHRQGRGPEDRDYDKIRPGDRSRSGEGSDGHLYDKTGKRGKPSGDRRTGEGPDERFGDKTGKRGKPSGDRRSAEGPDERFDDKTGKRGKPPGDRRSGEGPDERFGYKTGKRGKPPGDKRIGEGPDEGFVEDNNRKFGNRPIKVRSDDDGRARKEDKRGSDRPAGDTDGTKYRLVTMPKAATTLNTRRRYLIQVTDHEMKEPWFNSCFNISKENNVDFNYEGPVKITPYYIGDKLS